MNEEKLQQILKTKPDYKSRLAIIDRLDDEYLIAKYFSKDRKDKVRKSCLEKLKDETLIVQSFKDEKRAAILYQVIEKLNSWQNLKVMFFDADYDISLGNIRAAVDTMLEFGAPLEMLFEKAKNDMRFATKKLIDQIKSLEEFDEYFSEIPKEEYIKQSYLLERLTELKVSDDEIIKRFEDCHDRVGNQFVKAIDDISLIEGYVNHPVQSVRTETIIRLLRTGRDHREFNIEDFDFRCFEIAVDRLLKENDFEGLRKCYSLCNLDQQKSIVDNIEDIDILISFVDDTAFGPRFVMQRLEQLNVTLDDLMDNHQSSEELKMKIMKLKEYH